jgi:flagellar hook assembly protein FlgD
MPLILDKFSTATDYDVVENDTLESIANAKCQALGWKMLARYNWGTDKAPEVLRAIRETVGVKLEDLANVDLKDTPEKMRLKPDADLSPKLKIPKAWKKDPADILKTYTVNVKRKHPANAVSILELDKWFLPKEEECKIKYRLEGEKNCADKVELAVFGSQYCECTDWNKGLGTWGDPADLVDEPVYKLDLATQADERTEYASLPGGNWKGKTTTDKGMLGRKTGTATDRFINVAFSPYTAHFRYWKADGDKTAHLVLEPFWPQWEDVITEPTVSGGMEVDAPSLFESNLTTSHQITWTNADAADYGAIEVRDADGQCVYRAALTANQVKKGERDYPWDLKYRTGVKNGKFTDVFVDDSTTADPQYLFRNAPYVYKIWTVKRKPINESLKISWKVRNTTKLERGFLEITDGTGKLVFQKPLKNDKFGADNSYQWDGKYGDGVKNSKDGTEIIPEDMPYRVQIQGHTDIDTPEGLALAAMHTEVRLYVHKDMRRPKDKRFDPMKDKPSLSLTKAPFIAVEASTLAEGSTKWCRNKLAEAGFHPGPVTDKAAANPEYHIALKEFKRSVPSDGGAGPGNFARLTVDVAENDALKTAINSLRGTDKRKPFGDPDKVKVNDEAPDLNDDAVKERLPDAEKEMILWVDDRQYFTNGWGAKDENNADFISGKPIGLGNYRLFLDNGDDKTGIFDAQSVSRPWIPLQVDIPVMGREDKLDVAYDKAKVVVDGSKRDSMRQAIGPLRVDWTFDELPMDVQPIERADYNAATIRARKYVAWALHKNKEDYERKDTKSKTRYTNCKTDLGGIRPDSAAGAYFKEAFGAGDLNLDPSPAVAVDASESVATIVHDHIAASQTNPATELYEKRIGTAGIYFHPSRIAGDGYQVRAEVKFKTCTGYAFPNLEALKKRYPVRPQAFSAQMRVWRRSSFRGYMYWASSPPAGHWPDCLARFRKQYRAAHVYFVHEGGGPTVFAANTLFDLNRYKKIVENNLSDANLKPNGVDKITLRADSVWPWQGSADFGWPYLSTEGMQQNQLWNWLCNDILNSTWYNIREGLLLSALEQVEAKGLLRGHLIAEFKESVEDFSCRQYECNSATTKHTYWLFQRGDTSAAQRVADNAWNCLVPNCSSTAHPNPPQQSKLFMKTASWVANWMPCAAVGLELGVTWVFASCSGNTCSEAEFVADTWAHEVGHHRHLKHSATAPEAQYSSNPAGSNDHHDSERNSGQFPTLVTPNFADERWDRDCIMSYAVGARYFCGKCLLRNMGWKIMTLGYPAADQKEPT